MEEGTGYALDTGGRLQPLGAFYSLPSETNKYTHVFLVAPVAVGGPAEWDAEIEKYFDLSVTLIPVTEAIEGVGGQITSMETVGALMAAYTALHT